MSGINLIQKQIVSVEYNGINEDFALPQKVSDWCHTYLLPQLEKKLERFAGMKETIRLDSLEINLEVERNKLDENLSQKIVSKLEYELNKKVFNTQAENKNVAAKNGQRFFDVLLFFLQNGFLPWWSPVQSVNEFEKQIENLSEVEFNAQELQKAFRKPFSLERLILLRRNDLWEKVMVSLSSITNKQLKDFGLLMQKLSKTFGHKTDLEFFLLEIKKKILQKVISNENFSVVNLLDVFLNEVFRKFSINQLTSFGQQPNLPESFKNEIKRRISRPLFSQTEEIKKEFKEDLKPLVSLEKLEGIYINNAGLVILAPYLIQFFNNAGLTAEGKLTNLEMAVSLLQWLVTGKEEFAEFEVVLPKILCGLEPEENLALSISIPEKLKEEGRLLLESVIEHWSVLKNTSEDGLREAFLQRSGKLTFKNDSWLLVVEQKGYDLLLEHLPVTISIIKLPWMKFLLKTEWK